MEVPRLGVIDYFGKQFRFKRLKGIQKVSGMYLMRHQAKKDKLSKFAHMHKIGQLVVTLILLPQSPKSPQRQTFSTKRIIANDRCYSATKYNYFIIWPNSEDACSEVCDLRPLTALRCVEYCSNSSPSMHKM